MGPPELHVVLVGLGGLFQAVGKVEQSAVLVVPAGLDGPVEDLGGLFHQFLVPGALGVLQQEPHALDVVSGVDRAALGVVETGRAVLSHVLQNALEVGLDVVLEDLVHALGGPLLIERLALRVYPQQHAGDIEDDHGDAEGTARAGLGDGLGAQSGGVGHAVGQIPVQVVGAAGPVQMLPLAGHAVVLAVGHGVEGLREIIPALTQGAAVLRDGEIHAAAGIMVDAVLLQKVQAALGGLQPLRTAAVHVAEIGEDPAAAALHPNAFIRGVDLALAVQAGVYTAVLVIHSVFQPEFRADLQLLLHPVPVGLQSCCVLHTWAPSFLLMIPSYFLLCNPSRKIGKIFSNT